MAPKVISDQVQFSAVMPLRSIVHLITYCCCVCLNIFLYVATADVEEFEDYEYRYNDICFQMFTFSDVLLSKATSSDTHELNSLPLIKQHHFKRETFKSTYCHPDKINVRVDYQCNRKLTLSAIRVIFTD